jgi:hypothetical protein
LVMNPMIMHSLSRTPLSINRLSFVLCFVGLVVFLAGLPSATAQELQWTKVTPTGLPENLIVNNNFGSFMTGRHDAVYIVNSQGLYTSADGEAWTSVANTGYTVASGNFASGTTSFCGYAADGGIFQLHEVDGSWTSGSIPGLFNFAVTRLGDRLVAAGDGNNSAFSNPPIIAYSDDDGATWTMVEGFEPDMSDANVNPAFRDLIVVDGVLYAAGMPNAIFTSTDGASWTEVRLIENPNISGAYPESQIFDLEYANGLFVGVGIGIWTSTDGVNWTDTGASTTGVRPYVDVSFSGDEWVAIANDGYLARSEDGAFWSANNDRNRTSFIPAALGYYVVTVDILSEGTSSFFNGTDLRELLEGTGNNIAAAAMSDRLIVSRAPGVFYIGTQASSFLDGATTPDGENYNIEWFGWFVPGATGWFYHYNLGWCFTTSQSSDAMWIYQESLGWIYVAEGVFPSFYHFASGDWGFYAGQNDWFFNTSRDTWQQSGEFGQDPWVVSADWLIGKSVTITDSIGTHQLEIVSAAAVNATLNTPNGVLSIGAGDSVTWFDSSFAASLLEGRRFTFDVADATNPGIGNRSIIVLTFDDATGGSSRVSYTILNGLIPVSQSDVIGTFTVD